jgi:hypothetical protein
VPRSRELIDLNAHVGVDGVRSTEGHRRTFDRRGTGLRTHVLKQSQDQRSANDKESGTDTVGQDIAVGEGETL